MILALDTSGAFIDASVVRGGEILAHHAERHNYVAESVLGLIHRALSDAQVELRAVEKIGVAIGPGSFTGIRTGLSTVLALHQALGTELVGCSTLLAHGAKKLKEGRSVTVFQEANSAELYSTSFSLESGVILELSPPVIVPQEEGRKEGTESEVWGEEDGRLSLSIASLIEGAWSGGGAHIQRGGTLKPLYIKGVNALTLLERGVQRRESSG